MRKRLKWLRSLIGYIFKDTRDQLNGIVRDFLGSSTGIENFVPLIGLDVWEFEFRIVGVHRVDLVSTGRSEDLDDLYELVDT